MALIKAIIAFVLMITAMGLTVGFFVVLAALSPFLLILLIAGVIALAVYDENSKKGR